MKKSIIVSAFALMAGVTACAQTAPTASNQQSGGALVPDNGPQLIMMVIPCDQCKPCPACKHKVEQCKKDGMKTCKMKLKDCKKKDGKCCDKVGKPKDKADNAAKSGNPQDDGVVMEMIQIQGEVVPDNQPGSAS